MHALTRRERLEFLLDHWDDFFDPACKSPGAGSDNAKQVALLPRMSRHPSVVALAQSVDRLRVTNPVQCAHLMGYYRAEWRNTTRLGRQRTRTGKWATTSTRVRARVVPPWVRMEKVRRAVDEIDRSRPPREEWFIPDELLEAVA